MGVNVEGTDYPSTWLIVGRRQPGLDGLPEFPADVIRNWPKADLNSGNCLQLFTRPSPSVLQHQREFVVPPALIGVLGETPPRYADPGGTLTKLLIEWRESRNMTLRDLAKIVGVSAPTLCRIMNGKKVPSWDLLTKILAALGMKTDEITSYRTLWREALAAHADRQRPAAVITGQIVSSESEGAAHPPEHGVDPQCPYGQIVIHGGAVHLHGRAATEGRVVVVHEGTVALSGGAAEAAAGIVVHGGEVNIHEDTRDDMGNATDRTASPASRPALRSVG